MPTEDSTSRLLEDVRRAERRRRCRQAKAARREAARIRKGAGPLVDDDYQALDDPSGYSWERKK